MGLKPADLARWTRFAAKGGIGKCVAQCDCVAESSDDLMFLKVCCLLDFSASFASSLEQDDEITVLLQIPDLENFFLVCIPIAVASRTFLQPHFAQGYCEGVVGRFSGLDVKFLGRLKKPVMTK